MFGKSGVEKRIELHYLEKAEEADYDFFNALLSSIPVANHF
jgi:hypothetical protein